MPARKSSTSLAVDGPLRDESATAAERAGMPVGQWLERTLRMALDGGAEPAQPEGGEIGGLEGVGGRGGAAEPAQPEGVEIGELEAMVRRVVAEELRPVGEALARAEARTAVSD